MISADVDLTDLRAALKRFEEVTGKGRVEVIRDQSRLLVRDLVRHTAPESRAKAAKKIARDVGRVFLTARKLNEQIDALVVRRTTDFVDRDLALPTRIDWRNKRLGERMKHLWNKEDAAGIEAIWRNVHTAHARKLVVTEDLDEKRLRAARSARTGSVPIKLGRTAVIYAGKPAKLKALIRKLQDELGIAKAGWAPAADALGAPLPAFVRKQGRRYGSLRLDLRHTAMLPFVEITNRAIPALAQERAFGLVKQAVHGRERALHANIERLIARAAAEASHS